MKTKQMDPKLLVLIAAVMALVIAVGAVWFLVANVIVAGGVYPRNAEFLNLREKDLTLEQYEAIHKKLPNCQLYWSVPFQGQRYDENTVKLTITTLSAEDLAVLDYFNGLQLVDARACTDYANLAALRQKRPDLAVLYQVSIDGTVYSQDAETVELKSITDEEIALVQYLPMLTTVEARESRDYGQLAKLQDAYPQLQVFYNIEICGESFSTDATELTVTGMTDEETQVLRYFPGLAKVHLVDPAMAAETLLALPDEYPNVTFTWEKSVLGMLISGDATHIDLMDAISPQGAKAFDHAKTATVTGKRDDPVLLFKLDSRYPVPDMTDKTEDLIRQVEDAMAYFPNVEQVTMNGAFLDNEAMAAFREKHRQDYKVVWTVKCGTMAARTDTTYFMPYKFGVAYFFDEYTQNLRYCEDIICVDLGHMSVSDTSFAAHLPKLKYLILAHTQVKDITPLQNCKSLVFLELDWSIVRDYTPLKGCTALEDLNLSKTYADVTPLLEMTWLKRLWIIDRGLEAQQMIRDTFEGTETQLYLAGEYTVGGGWRETENYYAMRDALGMEYMK